MKACHFRDEGEAHRDHERRTRGPDIASSLRGRHAPRRARAGEGDPEEELVGRGALGIQDALKEATKKLVCLFLALRVAVVGFTSITAPSEDRGSEARGAATALLVGIAIAATRSATAERAVSTRVVMATQYGPGGG